MVTAYLADPPVLVFVVLPAVMAVLFVWAVAATGGPALRAAALTLIWMGGTLALADRGVFRNWDATPPPFALLVVALLAIGFWIALSSTGQRLATGVPLWALVIGASSRCVVT